VKSILVINRKSIELDHPKLKEIIHSDFFNLSPIKEDVKGYNACFFCLGVSSVGLNEETFHKLTYELTIHFAETVIEQSADMTFNYVSGAGTDSSEKGSSSWARVKGKTENKILGMPFNNAYMFRPGAILPEKGVKSNVGWYNIIYVVLKPFFPLLKKMKSITTSTRLGQAMINSILNGYSKKHLENYDINLLAK
ncbi:epimerase, partial [Vicingaceae bacterium]|nr:epimerase [Vicingaceae bacterium]